MKGESILKRFHLISLTAFILAAFLALPVCAADTGAEGESGISATFAINENIALAGGIKQEITPPLLVLGKTYVDIYAAAPMLGISPRWVPDDIGYFEAYINGSTVNFTPISQWDELLHGQYKFFVKDGVIFVSLRELADLAGCSITYTDGIIRVGDAPPPEKELYGDISTQTADEYVYLAYPRWAEYTVNPYQVYSYEDMLADAEELRLMYPELIKTSSIGKSVENRDLLLIELGRGDKKIFVCGTHHAREYIATTYLMYAIDRYAYAYKTGGMWESFNVKEILDNVTFCIVPMVNPDGVNLVQNGIGATTNPEWIASMKIYEGARYGYSAWKANVRGVDVNWNYNKDWFLERNKNPRGSTGFNGEAAGTEPETAAVSAYVDSHEFAAYFSFHTQGEEFYWSDNAENPTNLPQLIAADTGFDGFEDDGTGMGGSFFDYVYRQYHKPTVTVELCPYVGNFPYPNENFDRVWKPAKNIILIAGREMMYR